MFISLNLDQFYISKTGSLSLDQFNIFKPELCLCLKIWNCINIIFLILHQECYFQPVSN
jgi:hypothetical protein